MTDSAQEQEALEMQNADRIAKITGMPRQRFNTALRDNKARLAQVQP